MLPLRGGFVNRVAFSLADGDDDNNKLAVADFIHQAITDTPKFDFESVFMA